MASAARMVLKPSSHSSITGRRRCSHSNVAGGWTLLRTLGAPLTVARCSSSPRRGHGGMAVGRLHAAVGREMSCHGLQERGAGPERDVKKWASMRKRWCRALEGHEPTLSDVASRDSRTHRPRR